MKLETIQFDQCDTKDMLRKLHRMTSHYDPKGKDGYLEALEQLNDAIQALETFQYKVNLCWMEDREDRRRP